MSLILQYDDLQADAVTSVIRAAEAEEFRLTGAVTQTDDRLEQLRVLASRLEAYITREDPLWRDDWVPPKSRGAEPERRALRVRLKAARALPKGSPAQWTAQYKAWLAHTTALEKRIGSYAIRRQNIVEQRARETARQNASRIQATRDCVA